MHLLLLAITLGCGHHCQMCARKRRQEPPSTMSLKTGAVVVNLAEGTNSELHGTHGRTGSGHGWSTRFRRQGKERGCAMVIKN
ncbi:PAS domain S-box protein [Sesbania bispinosa]|nr:PAS domain S-box protein [Sesbania bispinosa]